MPIRLRLVLNLWHVGAALLLLMTCADQLLAGQTEQEVVAKGHDFVVTQKDVQELKAYYDRKGFRTTPAEYTRVTVMYMLFAKEAKALDLEAHYGLQIKDDVGDFKRKMILSRLYMNKLFEDYAIDEQVLRSFYLAHPERFPAEGNATQGVAPFDAQAKKAIKKVIIRAQGKTIKERAFETLKTKYDVQTSLNGKSAS